MGPTASDVDSFADALLSLDESAAAAALRRAADGAGGTDYLDAVVVPALVQIGEGWTAGRVSLSQVYMSGRLCQRLIEGDGATVPALRPSQPRLAVCVLADSHVLGKQIVVHLLRSSGYQVSDWGAKLEVDEVVRRVNAEGTDVLFVSVLMLRSALAVANVKAALAEAGSEALVVVGGAPFRFDPGLGSEVGADFVGTSASDVLPIMAAIEHDRLVTP